MCFCEVSLTRRSKTGYETKIVLFWQVCLCGSQVEDFEHVILECPSYHDARLVADLGLAREATGGVDYSRLLLCPQTRERFEAFAKAVFEKRRLLMQDD